MPTLFKGYNKQQADPPVPKSERELKTGRFCYSVLNLINLLTFDLGFGNRNNRVVSESERVIIVVLCFGNQY